MTKQKAPSNWKTFWSSHLKNKTEEVQKPFAMLGAMQALLNKTPLLDAGST